MFSASWFVANRDMKGLVLVNGVPTRVPIGEEGSRGRLVYLAGKISQAETGRSLVYRTNRISQSLPTEFVLT